MFTVSVHFLEKWRHFVSSKALLCFRVRVRAGVSGNTFSRKCNRTNVNIWYRYRNQAVFAKNVKVVKKRQVCQTLFNRSNNILHSNQQVHYSL